MGSFLLSYDIRSRSAAKEVEVSPFFRLNCSRITGSEFLFAAVLGLAVEMLRQRVTNVYFLCRPVPWVYLPLLAYQDVFVMTVLAWVAHGFFWFARSPRASRSVTRAGYCVVLLLAVWGAVDNIIFSYLHTDATYKLFILSDDLHLISGSIPYAMGAATPYVWVLIGILTTIAVTEGLSRYAPDFLRHARARFYSPLCLALILIYVVGAHAWAARHLRYPSAALNAEWAFISPWFEKKPLPSSALADYYDDFEPEGRRPAYASVWPALLPTTPRYNVVMVVMESVGAHNLGLYGAPYDDTPQLKRLESHAAVFNHIYAAQGNTSAAMTALFCSLYPRLDWFPVPRWHPDLASRGLPALLEQHGYATALIDSGSISEDRRSEFLLDHGFTSVVAEHRDPRLPQDPPLLSAAVDWIDAHRTKPFFLTLWTMDTHHPYIAAGDRSFAVRDPMLNRYLNGVQSIDALIGRLADRLQQMGLADNTLLVITGDHGEAFGEHGETVHGFTVYNEELQVPLMIVNPRLFRERLPVDQPGRQIDIAPTLLSLLGLPSPAQWQGVSLFRWRPHRRAYLFADDTNFILGVIDAHMMKYIYDFNLGRAQLYDLAADPDERHDLAGDSTYAATMARDKLRLQAWASFQDPYLRSLAATADNQ